VIEVFYQIMLSSLAFKTNVLTQDLIAKGLSDNRYLINDWALKFYLKIVSKDLP
jgi:hypothetical protein